jgi:hypothetical protein
MTVHYLRAFAGALHFLLGGIGFADSEVLGDRAIEQQHLLEDDADFRRSPTGHDRGYPILSIFTAPDCGSKGPVQERERL